MHLHHSTNSVPDNPSMDLDPKYDHYDFPTTSPEKKSGHPGHTTKEQDAQVHQLRMALEQAGYTERLDTLTLLRFLRARKFDVEKAKQMDDYERFIECEKWRKEFGVDYLVRNFNYEEKEKVAQYYPQYYHKTDKDGRPVYIEQLGKIDLTAMYKITSAERMLQHLVVEYEKVADPRLPACSRKAGKLLETCCSIMDLKGVGLYNLNQVYNYVKQASAISQNYYPERLGRLYLINAPWGFSTVFSAVKGFLDPVTVEKIHVLGYGYQAELLKHIPKENLPKLFGGECECPGHGGCSLSDLGPWQEKEWARPPKWMQDDNKKNENKPTKTMEAGNTGVDKNVEKEKSQGQTSTTTTGHGTTGAGAQGVVDDEEAEAIRVAKEIMQSGPSPAPTQTIPAPAAQPGATSTSTTAAVPQATVNVGGGIAAAPVPGAAPAPM